MKSIFHQSFPDSKALDQWLAENHAHAQELWIRVYKAASGKQSVTWTDCVVEAIRYGWIDGQKKPLDQISYLQRLSPRKPQSVWSMKNREYARKLMEEGRMKAAGLKQIELAQKDGRWEKAYTGSRDMEIPEDFLLALKKHPPAEEFFATLNRQNHFAIYHRLHTARGPETRTKRIA